MAKRTHVSRLPLALVALAVLLSVSAAQRGGPMGPNFLAKILHRLHLTPLGRVEELNIFVEDQVIHTVNVDVLANYDEGVVAALNDPVDPQYLGAPVSRGDLVAVLSQQLEDANNGRINQLATFLWQLGVVLVPGTTRATIKQSRDILAVIQNPVVLYSPATSTVFVFGDIIFEDLISSR